MIFKFGCEKSKVYRYSETESAGGEEVKYIPKHGSGSKSPYGRFRSQVISLQRIKPVADIQCTRLYRRH